MLRSIFEWFQAHPAISVAAFVVSIGAIMASMVLVPLVVVRIPANYFTTNHPAGRSAADRHLAWRIVLVAMRNLLGIVLLLLGLVMLITPGQGVITLLVGQALLDIPGKRRLERWIVSRPPLLRTINKLHTKAGRAPLELSSE